MTPTICEKCNQEIQEGHWPFCPHPLNNNYGVIGDDIPGGIEIRHGICWPDGTPRKFYSKTEIRKAAYESGLTIHGETPNPNPRIKEERHREAEKAKRPWY